MTPLIYAADQGFDDMCIYLSLRTKNIDQVCEKTGKNILVMYIIKKNKEMKYKLGPTKAKQQNAHEKAQTVKQQR